MKRNLLTAAISLAFVSCGAHAGNYVTQPQLASTNAHIEAVQTAAQIANEKADAGAVRADRIEGSLANTDNRSIHNAVRLDGVEATVGSNTTDIAKHKAYQEQINKGQSSVNAGQSAVNKAQSGVNESLSGRIDQNKGYQEQVNAGQSAVNAGQSQVNKAQSGVNNDLYGKVGANKANQDKVNAGQAAVNEGQSQVNAGQSQVNAAQGGVNTDIYSKLGTTSTTLNEYGTRLDGYGGDINNLRNDFGSAMANIDGRLGGMENRIRKAEKKADRAEEGSAVALAVAGHQFNTEPSAGFQVAASASTTGNKQGIALGMGGAINEKWFVNAGFGSSGSTTAGVVSTTYSFGR